MSYNWLTQYNSPNYTPANRVQATWGRPRTIEAIAIHWWGDPNTNPSFEGVVSVLTNPSRGASAHLVASGTGRKVACLVNFADASWATNSANPYTISIECDPRCRPEDYDVIAEVIAQLRQVYGNLPLVPHKQFVSTACPGNYDLGRLDREARNKIAKPEWDWGHVENKPTAPAAPKWVNMDNPRHMIANEDLFVYDLVANKNVGDVIKKNTDIEFVTKADWNGKLYLRSKSSTTGNRNWGVDFNKLRELPAIETKEEKVKQAIPFATTREDDNSLPKGEEAVRVKGVVGELEVTYAVTYTDGKETNRIYKSEKIVKQPVTQIIAVGTHEKPSNDGFTENDRNTLLSIQKALEWLTNAFKAIFKV